MKELIKVKNEDGRQLVSARDLHIGLKVKTDFTDWCKRMFEYGFENNVDYSLLKIGEGSAHNKIDFVLTLDTAKEISMLQRTDKGKEVRRYLIEIEKKYNFSVKKYLKDPFIMFRMDLIDANDKIEDLEKRHNTLEDIVTLEMKVDKEKLRTQQSQLDKLWDIQDRQDLY